MGKEEKDLTAWKKQGSEKSEPCFYYDLLIDYLP